MPTPRYRGRQQQQKQKPDTHWSDGLWDKISKDLDAQAENDGPKSSYNPPPAPAEPPAPAWDQKFDVAGNLKSALKDYSMANNRWQNNEDIPDSTIAPTANPMDDGNWNPDFDVSKNLKSTLQNYANATKTAATGENNNTYYQAPDPASTVTSQLDNEVQARVVEGTGQAPTTSQLDNEVQARVVEGTGQAPPKQTIGNTITDGLDWFFKKNPVSRFLNRPFAAAAAGAIPDAPMIGKRPDGSYGNLEGTNAREQYLKENPIASTGNATADNALDFVGGMGSMLVPINGAQSIVGNASTLVKNLAATKLGMKAEEAVGKLGAKAANAVNPTMNTMGIHVSTDLASKGAQMAAHGLGTGAIYGAAAPFAFGVHDTSRYDNMAQSLNQQKPGLDKLVDGLKSEQADLEKLKSQIDSETDPDLRNQHIDIYNTMVNQYQNHFNEYSSQEKNFNDKAKQADILAKQPGRDGSILDVPKSMLTNAAMFAVGEGVMPFAGAAFKQALRSVGDNFAGAVFKGIDMYHNVNRGKVTVMDPGSSPARARTDVTMNDAQYANPNDLLYSIQNRVVQGMDDLTKAEYDVALKDAKDQGIAEPEAHRIIMNTLAETPEGQQLITQAAHDVAQSHDVKAQAMAPANVDWVREQPISEQKLLDTISQVMKEQGVVEGQPKAETTTTPESAPTEITPKAANEFGHIKDVESAGKLRDQLQGQADGFREEFNKPFYSETSPQYDGTNGPNRAGQEKAWSNMIAKEAEIKRLDAHIESLKQPKVAATPPAKASKLPDVAEGQSVNLKGKGTQNFTVTGVKGDFVSLVSEKGGEIPKVHKSALVPQGETAPVPKQAKVQQNLSQLSDQELNGALLQGFFKGDNGALSPEEQANFDALQGEKDRREKGKTNENRANSGFAPEQWSAFDKMKQDSEIKKNGFEPINLITNPQTKEQIITGFDSNGKMVNRAISDLNKYTSKPNTKPTETAQPVENKTGIVHVRKDKGGFSVVGRDGSVLQTYSGRNSRERAESVARQKMIEGKYIPSYGGGEDYVKTVHINGSDVSYTVIDTKTNEVRNHSTTMKSKEAYEKPRKNPNFVPPAAKETAPLAPSKESAVDRHMKAANGDYEKAYQSAQNEIDTLEDEIIAKHGEKAIVNTPAEYQQRMNDLLDVRDEIGQKWDEQQIQTALKDMPKGGPATKDMMEKALKKIQREFHWSNINKTEIKDKQISSMVRGIYTSLSHDLAMKGDLPDGLAGDLEAAIDVAKNWPNTHYGMNPTPLLRQARDMGRSLFGESVAVDDVFKGVPFAERKEVKPEPQKAIETSSKQTITLYHGSDKTFDKFSPNKAQAGEGIFLTDSQDAAKEYGKNLYEVQVQANKIADDGDWRKAYDELENAHIKKMGELETKLEDGEITQAEYDKAEKEWIIGEDADLKQNAKVSQRLKEQGFDAYQGDLQSGDKGKEYLVLDDSVIKSVKNTSTPSPIEETKAEVGPIKFEKLFFSVNPNTDEIQAVKQAKPKSVLLSFSRWGRKDIKDDFVDVVGYKPTIIMDSGAFTFQGKKDVGLYDIIEMYAEPIREEYEDGDGEEEIYARVADHIKHDIYASDRYPDSKMIPKKDGSFKFKEGKPMELPVFHKYIEFLDENQESIDYVMTLDDMNDPDASLFSFKVMNELDYNLVPIFHFGSDMKYLQEYVDAGADYIALGGSALLPDGKKRPAKERIDWAKPIIEKYPNVKFHMLGTNDKNIINGLPGLYSVDGTAWQHAARNGTQEERAISGAASIAKHEQKYAPDIEVGSTIEFGGKKYTVEDVSNPKRFLVNDGMGAQLEISKSLIKPDGQGIIVKLYDGPPDSLDMTVHWNGKESDSLILEEELDPSFYPDGTDVQTMGYETALFRIQEYAKYDSGQYVSADQVFTKDEGINVAEKLLQEKYAPKAEPKAVSEPKKASDPVKQFQDIRKAIKLGGDYTVADVKEAFGLLRSHEAEFKADILKRINEHTDYKRKRNDTKTKMVDQAYDNYMMDLVYANGDSFSMELSFSGDAEKRRIQAIEKHIDNMTDESIQKYRDKKQAERDKNKKIMENPETLEELRRKKYHTELTADEQARLDELEALNTKENKQAEKAKVSAVMSDSGMFTVSETKHTKTGETIYVAKLNGRVETAQFKEIQKQMGKIGGGWSRFTNGFNFKTDPTEKLQGAFPDAQNEPSAPSEVPQGESTAQVPKTAQRLRELADNMQKTIDDKHSTNRLTNTAKRSREAASAASEGDYLKRIQGIMRNIADAMESGSVTHLDGITARTHIELLNTLIGRRVRDVMQANGEKMYDNNSNPIRRDPKLEDINGMEYPKPQLHMENLKRFVDLLIANKVSVRLAGKLDKLIYDTKKNNKDAYMVDVSRYFDEVLDLLNTAEKSKIKDIADYGTQLKDRLTEAKRLLAMGLETPEQLRSALREFLQYREGTGVSKDELKQRELKAKGDELARSKIAGFFPTPKDVVERMIDEADIKEGMRVLEPSAGKGNIADAIREAEPKAKLEVIEWNGALRGILVDKGHEALSEADFLKHEVTPLYRYDRIIMNPPFENGQDIDHVLHAYDLLKPGGRIVAIMSEGPFGRSDKKATAFREWLDEHGVSEKLPEGSFKSADRPTGVATRMVTIDKPTVDEGVQPATKDTPIGKNEVEFTWNGEPFRIKKGDSVDHFDRAATPGEVVEASHEILKVVDVNPEQQRITTEDSKGRQVYMRNGEVAPLGTAKAPEIKEGDRVTWFRDKEIEGENGHLTGTIVKAISRQSNGEMKLEHYVVKPDHTHSATVIVKAGDPTLQVTDGKAPEPFDIKSITAPGINDEIVKLLDERNGLVKDRTQAGNTNQIARFDELENQIDSVNDDIVAFRSELIVRQDAKYPEVLPLYDDYFMVNAQIDKLEKKSRNPHLDQIAKYFHLGTVGGSGNRQVMSKLNRTREKAMDKSIEHAKTLVPLYEKRNKLETAIENIERGKKAKSDEAKAKIREEVQNAGVGDIVLDSAYGEMEVIRVNKKTLTLKSTSGSDFTEARPFDLIMRVLKKAPAAEVPAPPTETDIIDEAMNHLQRSKSAMDAAIRSRGSDDYMEKLGKAQDMLHDADLAVTKLKQDHQDNSELTDELRKIRGYIRDNIKEVMKKFSSKEQEANLHKEYADNKPEIDRILDDKRNYEELRSTDARGSLTTLQNARRDIAKGEIPVMAVGDIERAVKTVQTWERKLDLTKTNPEGFDEVKALSVGGIKKLGENLKASDPAAVEVQKLHSWSRLDQLHSTIASIAKERSELGKQRTSKSRNTRIANLEIELRDANGAATDRKQLLEKEFLSELAKSKTLDESQIQYLQALADGNREIADIARTNIREAVKQLASEKGLPQAVGDYLGAVISERPIEDYKQFLGNKSFMAYETPSLETRMAQELKNEDTAYAVAKRSVEILAESKGLDHQTVRNIGYEVFQLIRDYKMYSNRATENVSMETMLKEAIQLKTETWQDRILDSELALDAVDNVADNEKALKSAHRDIQNALLNMDAFFKTRELIFGEAPLDFTDYKKKLEDYVNRELQIINAKGESGGTVIEPYVPFKTKPKKAAQVLDYKNAVNAPIVAVYEGKTYVTDRHSVIHVTPDEMAKMNAERAKKNNLPLDESRADMVNKVIDSSLKTDKQLTELTQEPIGSHMYSKTARVVVFQLADGKHIAFNQKYYDYAKANGLKMMFSDPVQPIIMQTPKGEFAGLFLPMRTGDTVYRTAAEAPTIPESLKRPTIKGVFPKEAPAKSVEETLASKISREKASDNLGIVPNVLRARRGKPTGPHAFTNPDIEKRFQGSVIPKDRLMGKIVEKLTEFKHRITREFEHLPHTAEFAQLRTDLLRLNNQRGVASDRTYRNLIQGITRKLGRENYDLFRRKVFLDDLHQEDLIGNDLPWGFDSASLATEKAIIDAKIQHDPMVQEALQTRKDVWNEIKTNYIKAMDDIGFDAESKLQREDYIRHQVIEYANQRLDTSGKSKLRTPHSRGFLKQRQGYDGDINSDYLQAESEVMVQMLYDVERAKVIKMVDDQYNHIQKFKKQADAANKAAIEAVIEAEKESGVLMADVLNKKGEVIGEEAMSQTEMDLKAFDVKMAISFDRFSGMKAESLWHGGDREYKKAIALLTEDSSQLDKADVGVDAASKHGGIIFRYLAALAKQEDGTGVITARTLLKAIAQKRKLVKATLGEDFQTWKSILPSDYTPWQPREGEHFYMADSVNQEKLARDIAEGILTDLVDVEDLAAYLSPVMAKGGRRREFALKLEVAETLDNLGKTNHGWFYQANASVMKILKIQFLVGPTRVIKYNLRNQTGDLDKLIASNPAALKYVPKATKDLYSVVMKESGMDAEMQEWFNRGGMQTLLQTQEMGDINKLKMFIRFYGKDGNIPRRIWDAYWSRARQVTDYREAIFRYANYLSYLHQIDSNALTKKGAVPNNYGSSIPEEVDALPSHRDKAYKLGNEGLIDYNATSVLGKELRETTIPFWSFMEGNMRTTIQLLKNAAHDNKVAGAVGRKLLGKLVARSPYYAFKYGKLAILLSAFTVATQTYNNVFFRNEENELPENVKRSFHIVTGRDGDGKVRYFNNIGSIKDVLEWFGADQSAYDLQDILSGKRTFQEVAVNNLKKPLNKIAQGANAIYKFGIETAMGKKLYPDVTNPTDIHDRWQNTADLFGVKKEYDAIKNQVNGSTGPAYNLRNTLDYGADPNEGAYYDIMDLKRSYMKKIGKSSGSGGGSDKSNALFNYKQALRYGDLDAQDRYLMEYLALGGHRQGLVSGLDALDPMNGLSKTERVLFKDQLQPEDQAKLDRANDFYMELKGYGKPKK